MMKSLVGCLVENGYDFCVGGVGLKGGLELEVMVASFISCSAPNPLFPLMLTWMLMPLVVLASRSRVRFFSFF